MNAKQNGKDDKRRWVVSLGEYRQMEIELGPIMPLSVALRLCSVSKTYLYRLARRRWHQVFVQGQLHIPERQFVEWAEKREEQHVKEK